MSDISAKLKQGQNLSFEDSKSLFSDLMEGKHTESQIIGQVFGGKIVRAKNLMHGKTSKIKHKRIGLFRNIQNNFIATRYHSLVVDSKNLPKDLIITAETKKKTIMGLMHKDYDIHGFQFHPESISTKMGMKLIKNFINN